MQDVLDSINHMSEESQGKVKAIFKNTFRYCVENDIVTKDYSQYLVITAKKKRSSKDKFFTPEELGKVFRSLDHVVQFPTGKKSYAELNLTDTVLMLLYTGMRIGELLQVKSEDVDLENRIMRVKGTKTENADRTVPIHQDLVSAPFGRVPDRERQRQTDQIRHLQKALFRSVHGNARHHTHAARASTHLHLSDGLLRCIVQLGGSKKDRRTRQCRCHRALHT